jgi:hypothetical protein
MHVKGAVARVQLLRLPPNRFAFGGAPGSPKDCGRLENQMRTARARRKRLLHSLERRHELTVAMESPG